MANEFINDADMEVMRNQQVFLTVRHLLVDNSQRLLQLDDLPTHMYSHRSRRS